MRDLRVLNHLRIEVPGMPVPDPSVEGAFVAKSPIDGGDLRIIASTDLGWDHVSVSRKNRPPNWTEMSYVKRLCFRDHETAMQLHVPVSDHIDIHPYCLHLWRPHDREIPRPPPEMVGIKRGDVA